MALRLGVRQHMAALKFLYTRTLWKPEAVSFLSWPSDPRRLPTVLAADEVERILAALERPKYRVFFTTVYGTGLRVMEACQLETRDIDAARGVIHVRHGKGQKERFVMLSPRLLKILRRYWSLEQPSLPWVFESNKGGRPSNPEMARTALRLACGKAGVAKKRTVSRFCYLVLAMGSSLVDRQTSRFVSVLVERPLGCLRQAIDSLGVRPVHAFVVYRVGSAALHGYEDDGVAAIGGNPPKVDRRRVRVGSGQVEVAPVKGEAPGLCKRQRRERGGRAAGRIHLPNLVWPFG